MARESLRAIAERYATPVLSEQRSKGIVSNINWGIPEYTIALDICSCNRDLRAAELPDKFTRHELILKVFFVTLDSM
ncbi:hypothetical protein [Moorena sp. SIO3F7]|uniref:hypothetical protein n=1 Tax=Moorena sp. SIO3F7 TaxID=2607839 RepID=UPI0025DC10FD|nr:hypothetical protein [Moorena sp. SIO3F7]